MLNIGHKLSHKIGLILSIPLLAIVYFSSLELIADQTSVTEMNNITQLAELAGKISALVHENQKERGLSAGFLGSGGEHFSNQLKQQYQQTNSTLSEFNNFLSTFDANHFGSDFEQAIATVTQNLSRLDESRSAVQSLSIDVKDAVRDYSQKNAQLLELISKIIKHTSNADIAIQGEAYLSFLQSKERAGIERAVLSNAFVQNSFSPGYKNKFISLVAKQDAYMDTFLSLTDNRHISLYNSTMQGEAINEVERMRKLALNQDSNFNIEAKYWFQTISKKINKLKQIENQLSNDLLNKAQELKITAESKRLSALIIMILAIVATVVISIIFMRYITRMLKILSSSIQEIEETNNLSLRIDINSKDELQTVASAINRMLEKFQALIEKVTSSSTQLATASEEVSSVAAESASNVRHQQNETDQVASAINEMSATVQEVASNASGAADAAANADNEARSGKTVVENTAQVIAQLASEIESAATVITEVKQDSEDIGSVLDVIKGIAEQTNLLALNAAIEAARAGEQGRGFAVVADEVRTLASRTQESASEIETMIEKLQGGAHNAVGVMEKSREQAQVGVEQATDAAQSLTAIARAVTTITEMNTQIASAAEEQSAVSEEINKNIISISQVSEQTATGAEQTTLAANELAQLASDLQNLVGQFK